MLRSKVSRVSSQNSCACCSHADPYIDFPAIANRDQGFL